MFKKSIDNNFFKRYNVIQIIMGCCASAKTIPIDKITISLFGLDNAGKTCISHAIVGDFDFDCIPTVGFGKSELMYDNINLTIFDLGGSSKFRSVWQRYYAFIYGFIYVVDSSDKDRFAENKETLESIISDPMMAGKPYVVLSNKTDISDHASIDVIRKELNIPKNIKIYETIATEVKNNKCHDGITISTSDLMDTIIKKIEVLQKKLNADIEEQEEINRKEREEKLERIRRNREANSKQSSDSTSDNVTSTQQSTDNATSTNDTNMNKSTTIESNMLDDSNVNLHINNNTNDSFEKN